MHRLFKFGAAFGQTAVFPICVAPEKPILLPVQKRTQLLFAGKILRCQGFGHRFA